MEVGNPIVWMESKKKHTMFCVCKKQPHICKGRNDSYSGVSKSQVPYEELQCINVKDLMAQINGFNTAEVHVPAIGSVSHGHNLRFCTSMCQWFEVRMQYGLRMIT